MAAHLLVVWSAGTRAAGVQPPRQMLVNPRAETQSRQTIRLATMETSWTAMDVVQRARWSTDTLAWQTLVGSRRALPFAETVNN